MTRLLPALAACLLFGTAARAETVEYSFTGTVLAPTPLYDFYLYPVSDPAWIGRQVSGTVTMDFSVTPLRMLTFTGGSYLNAASGGTTGNWMTASIVNPDGSHLRVPHVDTPVPPGSAPEADNSLVQYVRYDAEPQQMLILDRTRYDGVTESHLGFDIRGAVGSYAEPFNPYGPFDTSRASQAIGVVAYYDNIYSGVPALLYSFHIDSLTVSTVPEPAPLAAMLAGLGALAVVARRERPAQPTTATSTAA